jgi:hypothetical protein
MSDMVKSDKARWFHSDTRRLDQFGWLLLLTILVIVLLSLIDLDSAELPVLSRIAAASVALFVGVTLLLALRASGFHDSRQRTVDVIVGVATAVLIAVSAVGGMAPSTGASQLRAVGFLIVVAFAVVTPIVIIRRLLQHRQVSTSTVLGAIAAYLLIPISYFYLFVSIEQLSQRSFFETQEPTTSFMYFSLATLTTLGYGDLSAGSDLGQLLATSEAVVGQIYLVTCVALIMGLFIQGWRTTHNTDSNDAG